VARLVVLAADAADSAAAMATAAATAVEAWRVKGAVEWRLARLAIRLYSADVDDDMECESVSC
jgi:hypothetical protein